MYSRPSRRSPRLRGSSYGIGSRVPEEMRHQMKAAGFSLGKEAVPLQRLDPEKLSILRALLREVVRKEIT